MQKELGELNLISFFFLFAELKVQTFLLNSLLNVSWRELL